METKRQVFFSFHYLGDSWRAGQVRNMGIVDNSSTWSGNDWEDVRSTNKTVIKGWIETQLQMRSCIVVLIGRETASREWVLYEIKRAYQLHKGIVGVYVHGLKDKAGNQSTKGTNPFSKVYTDKGEPLSHYVECYDSPYVSSSYVYDSIKANLPGYIERAIDNRYTY